MSPPADEASLTAPKDPAAYRPKPLLGVTFWAMMALMLLCVLAGVAIASFGPQLLAGRGPRRGPAETPLAAEPAAPVAPAATAVAPPAAGPVAPAPDIARLNARIAVLEAQQSHANQAAAAALAASQAVEASQGTGPFADELAALRAVSPPSPELLALSRLAAAGAPSRTALAASFPEYAALAASAARAPDSRKGADKARLGDRVVYELSRVVSLRRVGDLAGDGVDAVLARAERQVEDGDLDRALHTLDRLPPGAREALAPWRARAERRAEIDRSAAALRSRTLQMLASQAAP